ncbi:MAG: BspA family leucine-rich repeat surface protein [Muribaculaceae bacterium]|nr:BspA family leucine-rich repeat surface protein [Muribaculaceae bacterium]
MPAVLDERGSPEAYVCYTPENTTLTFYYDNLRSSRPGTIYDLNTSINDPGWDTDGTKSYVTNVIFDPSFADFPPRTTFKWFYEMGNLQTITGLSYLNTSEVIYMGSMFYGCNKLTRLDLSSFNTSKVTRMGSMFLGCSNLQTIYAGNGWSTAAVTNSSDMFYGCNSLVGGQGTTYDANHVGAAYAHIDGGPSNPGYFTDKNASLRGDVNGDGHVTISDVTTLINYLLTDDATGVNLAAADADNNTIVGISDVTTIINFLLTDTW